MHIPLLEFKRLLQGPAMRSNIGMADRREHRLAFCGSLKTISEGGIRGRASSLGTMEDMLRKSLDTSIPLHGVPFQPSGTWYWGADANTQGTLIDE